MSMFFTMPMFPRMEYEHTADEKSTHVVVSALLP
jgi:hypothetical protein